MDYDVHNTLYLQVDCPTVRPSLVVVSDTGDNVVEFGKFSKGQKAFQVVSIQNISEETLCLKSSVLNPLGPFEMVNALRSLEPDSVHLIKISFSPEESREFFEVLEVSSQFSTVQLKLKGEGVEPIIELEPSNGTMDVGDALVSDTIQTTLKMKNVSELSMQFQLKLGSLSTLKHSRTQTIPAYLEQYKDKIDTSFIIGTPNFSGIGPFDVQPSHGTLEPGELKEIEVSFAPDHVSENFREELGITINGMSEFSTVHLLGRAWGNIIYTRGWDRLNPTEESVSSQVEIEKDDTGVKTVLLSVYSEIIDDEYQPAEANVLIGCIRTAAQSKKSCDFTFENTKDAETSGFFIDPQRGGVDIGQEKPILFRWTAPADYDPNSPISTSVQLILRGDYTETYKVLLYAHTVTPVPTEAS